MRYIHFVFNSFQSAINSISTRWIDWAVELNESLRFTCFAVPFNFHSLRVMKLNCGCSPHIVFHSIQHHFIHFKRSEWKWVVELEWNDTFVQLPLNQSILSLLRFNEWMWFDFIGPFTAPAVWTRFTRGRCALFIHHFHSVNSLHSIPLHSIH